MSYDDALWAAREDERNYNASTSPTHAEHGSHAHRLMRRHSGHEAAEQREVVGPDVSSPLPMVVSGDPLNETSFVNPEDWQLQYNGMTDFETNEIGHSTYTIVITLVAVVLPIVLSVLRFIPGYATSGFVAFVKAWLITPAVWALYIALLSFLNIIFLIAPYVHTHPQSIFASGSAEQSLSTIDNRDGVMAMGNATAMFLFATRNNVLLFLTDWSHGTYILLHRVLGYWTIFHTALHSIMLLAYYNKYGSYTAEFARVYWQWGIVATVAACAILPTSLLFVRQRRYEVFKASHVGLTVLFFVGYYYYIWYCYGFAWGYEIFAYIVGSIWALEHILRIVRLARNGLRTAIVTPLAETNREYVRIEVEGVALHGTAYLTFPTLSWGFWESHPFSVAYTGEMERAAVVSPGPKDPSSKEASQMTTTLSDAPTGRRSVFFARTRTGQTSLLSACAASKDAEGIRLKVLIDGSYRSGAHSQLSECAALLLIGGGIGITALLQLAHGFQDPSRCHLYWGIRKRDLVDALAPQLARLTDDGDKVKTAVEEWLDLDAILRRELVGAGAEYGKLGIVVCGPPSMADAVREKVVNLSRQTMTRRPFVLVDEAFSW